MSIHTARLFPNLGYFVTVWEPINTQMLGAAKQFKLRSLKALALHGVYKASKPPLEICWWRLGPMEICHYGAIIRIYNICGNGINTFEEYYTIFILGDTWYIYIYIYIHWASGALWMWLTLAIIDARTFLKTSLSHWELCAKPLPSKGFFHVEQCETLVIYSELPKKHCWDVSQCSWNALMSKMEHEGCHWNG